MSDFSRRELATVETLAMDFRREVLAYEEAAFTGAPAFVIAERIEAIARRARRAAAIYRRHVKRTQ